MQNTKFVLLNGPSKSGRSTIARETSRVFQEHHISCVVDSFAAPAKHFFATALGQRYQEMPHESPRAELAGRSIHEAMVDLCENHCKQHFGLDIFGRWLYHRIGRLNPAPSFVIVDDLLFDEELDAFMKHKSIAIRVLRANREWPSGVADYLPNYNGVFDNNGDAAYMWGQCRRLAMALISGELHTKSETWNV